MAERILVPVAISAAGEPKLNVAMDQARARGAELLVLHVLPDRAVPPDGRVSEEEARARAYVGTLVARTRAGGVPTHPLVRVGPISARVVETARTERVSLIIIGSDARAGVARFLPPARGGSAGAIVRQAPCPVMLVRPAMEHAAPAPAVRCFAADAARTGELEARTLSARTVELARVIGTAADSPSAGELGRDFRPTRRDPEGDVAFRALVRSMGRGEAVPPVELYKLSYGYYVRSGHRVLAAARHLGQEWIDASVTEFLPLGDHVARRVFSERAVFERATGLTRIGAALPGSYPRLEQWIHRYARHWQIADQHQAAARWYASVFRPLQLRLRELRLAHAFPEARSADIALRVADHVERATGAGSPGATDLGWEEAIASFVTASREETPAA